jgi:hypothetical protein
MDYRKQLQHVKQLGPEDGKVFGKTNKVTMVNPHKTYFIAHYPGGKIIKGNNLFDTGWDELPDGIVKLEYQLSTGHVIKIPRFRAYLHLVEVSDSLDGGRIFHAVHIKGMADNNKVAKITIILKQDLISKFRIGDVVIGSEKDQTISPSWKLAAV